MLVDLSTEELRIIRGALKPKSPFERCPNCSFNPTSRNDYCDEHQPIFTDDADKLHAKLTRLVPRA